MLFGFLQFVSSFIPSKLHLMYPFFLQLSSVFPDLFSIACPQPFSHHEGILSLPSSNSCVLWLALIPPSIKSPSLLSVRSCSLPLPPSGVHQISLVPRVYLECPAPSAQEQHFTIFVSHKHQAVPANVGASRLVDICVEFNFLSQRTSPHAGHLHCLAAVSLHQKM